MTLKLNVNNCIQFKRSQDIVSIDMATKQDYDFVNPIPDDYLCGICMDVLQEPQAAECCGQHYCRDCLEKSFRRGKGGRRVSNATATKQCPHCRTDNFNHIKYLPLERKINDLMLYCPNRHEGCVIEVRLGDKENHKQKCDYATVSCPNSCGEQLLRKELQLHLDEVCKRRNVRCQYCGKEGMFYRITELHLKNCLKYPLPCDNGCGKVKIKREDMKQHRNVCPLQPVKCPYQEVGCTEKVTRKDLKSHEANSMQQHLSQLMSAHLKLENKFERSKNQREDHDDEYGQYPSDDESDHYDDRRDDDYDDYDYDYDYDRGY